MKTDTTSRMETLGTSFAVMWILAALMSDGRA